MRHFRSYLIGTLLVAAASAAVVTDLRIVAEIGGRPLLVADVEERLALERRQAAAAGRLDAFTSGAGSTLVRRLVDVRLLALGARDQGLDRRADVKRRLESVVDEFLAEQMVADIAGRVDLSDRALRGHYDAHKDAFQATSRVKARHIVVDTHAKAVTLLGRLKRSASFAALAREHNVDGSRTKDGDLGWVSRGVMVKAFEDALFALQPGAISPIVQTPFGFHIVTVEEIEAARAKPFDAVSADVRQKVIAEAVATAKAGLAKKHPVTVNEAVVRSIR